MFERMKTAEGRTHVTDDTGNDIIVPTQYDTEYDALCAVADAADDEHRAHCLQLTVNCPICKALANLDLVRKQQLQARRN